MRKTTCLALLLGVIFIGGCKPTIDTSTEESFKTSVEKVKNSLDKETQKKFGAALMIIAGKHMGDGPDAEKKAKAALNGKTADDIISEAEKDPNFKSAVEMMAK
jgi:hypothetical protein